MSISILTEHQVQILKSSVEVSLSLRNINFATFLDELKELAHQDIDIIFDAFIKLENKPPDSDC